MDLSIIDLMLYPNETGEILFVYHKGNHGHSTTECIICGRRGPGFAGTAEQIRKQVWSRNWQRLCSDHEHTHECACGKFFPGLHSLASHVAQCRRHNIEGHGMMSKVGW